MQWPHLLQGRTIKAHVTERTEQNIRLFRHSAYIAPSPNTNIAWKRKRKERRKKTVNNWVLNTLLLTYKHVRM